MNKFIPLLLLPVLLTVACIKTEPVESVDDGLNSIAYSTSDKKSVVDENGLRMRIQAQAPLGTHHLRLNAEKDAPYAEVPGMTMELKVPMSNARVIGNESKTIVADIFRIGKSNNFKSESFKLDKELEFELVDMKITTSIKEDPKYSVFDGQIFVYPTGRVVRQNPNPIRLTATVHFIDDFQGETAYMKLRIIVADDPAQQVKSITFFPDPISEDPRDPKAVTTFKPIEFKKTHFNTNIGLSRWGGEYSEGKIPGTWTSSGVINGRIMMGGVDPPDLRIKIIVKK